MQKGDDFIHLLFFLCRKILFLFQIIVMEAKELVVKILRPFISKYLIALVAFVVWIVFFDDNNLRQHQKNLQELAQLEEQVAFYKQKIEADKRKLYELQTNDENLEKFAREQFFMKKADEDIYVIVEEN